MKIQKAWLARYTGAPNRKLIAKLKNCLQSCLCHNQRQQTRCPTTALPAALPRVRTCSVAQSCLTLCDPMDYSHKAPLPIEFSRREYWSALPCSPPGIFPNQGSNHVSCTS